MAMADANAEKEDNINSLCKKLFTPQLCEEPVTESRRTLEMKLWSQMTKYGQKLSSTFKDITQEELEDVVISTISGCFNIWKSDSPTSSYTAYYASALKYNFTDKNTKARQRDNLELSLDTPVAESTDDGTFSLGDTIVDETFKGPDVYFLEQVAVKNVFLTIDRVFRRKTRSEWYKAIITCELYDELHDFYDKHPDERIEKLAFIDLAVYGWSEKPTQKAVAKYLGKDSGQVNRALKAFLEPIQEELRKDYDSMKGLTKK